MATLTSLTMMDILHSSLMFRKHDIVTHHLLHCSALNAKKSRVVFIVKYYHAYNRTIF